MASYHFKRLTNHLGQWIKKYFPGGRVWKWVTGAGGEGEIVEFAEIPLKPMELAEIINHRFDAKLRTSLTTVYGDPDFLPFAFLERGINCGAAVCRLVRSYGSQYDPVISPATPETLDENAGIQVLIQTITQQNKNRVDSGLPPFSQLDLAEILAIPTKPPEKRKKFFAGHEENPLNALKIEKLKALMPIPIGTGFLVGKDYLLTNHHVLPNSKEACEVCAQFGYEKDIFGRTTLPVEYMLDPRFFISNAALDYTLIKLFPHPELDDAGDRFGYLRMTEDPKAIAPPLTPKAAAEIQANSVVALKDEVIKRVNQPDLKGEYPGIPGEPVNIIQHPKGKPKEVILSSNRVLEITQDFIRYEADADFSSSGSPVLNQQWQLVGLHHGALANENWAIVAQEGIRMCRIVDDLRKKSSHLDRASKSLDQAAKKQSVLQEHWPILDARIRRKLLRQGGDVVQDNKEALILDAEILRLLDDSLTQLVQKPSQHPQDPDVLKHTFEKIRMDLKIRINEQIERLLKDIDQALEAASFPTTDIQQNSSSDDYRKAAAELGNRADAIKDFLSLYVNRPEIVEAYTPRAQT